MKNANYVVLDCETGGLSCYKNPITQFALIVIDKESLEEIVRWQTFVQPYADLTIEKQAITGTAVTMADVRKGITVVELVSKLQDILTRKEVRKQNKGKYASLYAPVIVGHNVSFDIGFIREAFKHAGKPALFYELFANNNGVVDYMDTMKMAKQKWDGQLKAEDNKSLSLGNVCKKLGIKLIGAHGAMEDTQATVEAFRQFTKIMRGAKSIKVDGNVEETEKFRATFQF